MGQQTNGPQYPTHERAKWRQYQAALTELNPLMKLDPALGTPEAVRLLELVARIEEYEKK